MAARCRALIIPYEVDMGDQLQHARAVECAGLVSLLRERDLTAEALLVAIDKVAQAPLPTRQVDTSGAEKSAQFLLSLADQAARSKR
jgi:predicted glycosyltransferase